MNTETQQNEALGGTTPVAQGEAAPIVYVDPATHKLTKEEAAPIDKAFTEQFEKMKALEVDYLAIIELSPDDPETGKKADELRKKYVKVRTGTEKAHKAEKAYFLNGGRYCDALLKTQAAVSEIKETKLKSIVDHAENEAKKERERIKAERVELLIQLGVTDYERLGLDVMAPDVWAAYLESCQKWHDERVAHEAQAAKQKAYDERLASITKWAHLYNTTTPGYRELTIDTTAEEWAVIRKMITDAIAAQPVAPFAHPGPPVMQPIAAAPVAQQQSSGPAYLTHVPPGNFATTQTPPAQAPQQTDGDRLRAFVADMINPAPVGQYTTTEGNNAHAQIIDAYRQFKAWATNFAATIK